MRLAALAVVALACRSAPALPHPAITRTALPAAGDVIAAVAHGDALYLFAPGQLTITPGGAVVPAPPGGWAEAIELPALDGDGRWVVARSGAGALWRITEGGEVEPLHDRLGLPPRVRSIAASPAGPGATVAIGLDDGIAVLRDRAHVARFAAAPGRVLAGRDRVAIERGDQLELWDLAAHTTASYRVPGAFAAGFAGDALVIAAPDALYVEAAGALHRRAVPGLRAIAIAGSRLWLVTAAGAAWLDGDVVVPAAAADHVLGLGNGDALATTRGGLARLAIAREVDDPRWLAEVAPIVGRVCLRCHGPGGRAGVDLSTAAAWRRDRAELIRRVVATRTMPPAGTQLDEADRGVLSAWLTHPAPP